MDRFPMPFGAILGLASIVLAVRHAARHWRRYRQHARRRGTVVERTGSLQYRAPIVHFVDDQGRERRFTFAYSGKGAVPVGSAVFSVKSANPSICSAPGRPEMRCEVRERLLRCNGFTRLVRVTNIAAANRIHARDSNRPLALLGIT